MFALEGTFTSAGCETAKDWEEDDWDKEGTYKALLLLEFLVGIIGRFTDIEILEVVSLLLWETKTEESFFRDIYFGILDKRSKKQLA